MSEALLLILFVLVLLMVRNELVGRWQMRAIQEIHEENVRQIDLGNYSEWRSNYDMLPDHVATLFDLTQWTYRSPFSVTKEQQ